MKSKLDSIQFLRFIAIIFVIYSHSFDRLERYLHVDSDSLFADMAFLGRSGVDLFFVISGFIMAYITSDSIENGTFDFWHFIKKRCIRIIPMYWIISTIVVLLLILKPSFFYNTTTSFLHSVGSFLFIPISSPDNKFAPVLGVGWTLNLEMYFYVSLGLFILYAKEKYLHYGLLFISLCCLLGYVIGHRESSYIYASITNSILFEFFFGIAAFNFLSKNKLTIGQASLALIASLIIICYSVHIKWPDEVRFLYWGGAYTIVLISFVSLEDKIQFPLIALKLGDASYTLYLTHYFFVAGVYVILNKYGFLSDNQALIPAFVFLCMTITCFAGVLCYYYIERVINQKISKLFS